MLRKVEILYDLLGLKISNTLNPTKKNNDNYINFNFKSIQDFIKKTHLLNDHFKKPSEVKSNLANKKNLALIPTMGNLHAWTHFIN